MFSRIFHRNTNIPTQNSEPHIQRSEITDPSEIQSSGGQTEDHIPTDEIQLRDGKRKQSIQSKDGTVSKYCRFELKPENIKNWMELTTSISLISKQIYVNSYIRERYTWKNTATNPIPHNVKGTQKLGEYIKEL